MATVFAGLAALGFAAALVSSKKGVQHVSTLGGFLISLPAALVVSLAVTAIDPPEAFPAPRVITVLVLSGLFTGIGRLLAITGLRRLAISVYTPLQTSIYPLTGVLAGLVLFGEQIGHRRSLGAATIVGGIWILSRARGAAELVEETGAVTLPRWRRSPSGLALLFPLGAGLAFAGSDISGKEAMLALPHPAFGAAISIFAACFVWVALLGSSPNLRAQTRFGPGKRWFVLHGVLSSLAIMCAFAALERGDVSIVSPIIATQPFVVLLLSAVFLRRIETVTTRAVIGAMFVVAGAMVVSLS